MMRCSALGVKRASCQFQSICWPNSQTSQTYAHILSIYSRHHAQNKQHKPWRSNETQAKGVLDDHGTSKTSIFALKMLSKDPKPA